jgi:class 3 adenylate cyclase/tetratricopeptide (TPR) repeat protein
MKCPRCQQDNPPQAKFCLECATPLALRCPSCGTSLPPGAKFCFECATPVGAPGAAPKFVSPETYTPKHLAERIINSKAALEGERKQVTVLFADLKGSMELLADRDPEEARKILDPVLELMMEPVHRYEGTVNQVMGDGIMALFGAPLAHEDHAIRACYAALRMQESVRQYAERIFRSHGIPVEIRVGLNSGEVVVRAIGSDLHMDYTAVGQTTHLAARMEQLAAPGTVRLTGETVRLVEGYVEVRSFGPIPVKGLPQPIEVFELTGAGQARTRLQAAALRGLTRFVGRDAEIEHLRVVLGRAAEGHGQVVAIVGEAGVGKSRLTYEFTHSHRVQDWLVLEASSVSYGKATSYLPAIDLLKSYFKIGDRDDHRDMHAKVLGRVLSLDRALESLLSPLLALLDVPVEDGSWQALDPPQRRQRTLDAVKRLLLRESQLQPLLVVFEDLHWIDGETQALLDSLVDSVGSARLVLLVNYRPEYRHGWGSKSTYSQMRLDALSTQHAGELLDVLLGADPDLQPLKDLLVKRGNPFFLEETVRTLVEAKALEGQPGRYRLTQPLQSLQVPSTVQAVLAARIDRLSAEDKRLLQTASVVGKDVPFALLQGIAGLSDDALRGALGRLQAAEFLYESGLFPDLEYAFKHALTHEVTYGTLLAERRTALHAAVVETMERVYAGRLDEHVEQLAHHAVRGGLRAKAASYLRQAGERAAARSAGHEAVSLLEQAVPFFDGLPETQDILAERADLHLTLGTTLTGIKGLGSPDVEAAHRQAHALAERLGDPIRRYQALWGLWFVKMGRGQYAAACELGNELLAIARRENDTVRLLEAHHALWPTLINMGDPLAALPHIEQGVALYDAERHHTQAFKYGGHDAGTCARYFFATAQWMLGYPDRAVTAIHEALRLAERLAHPTTMVIALGSAAVLHYQLGDWATARAHSERLHALADAHGLPAWIGDARVIQHCIAAREGGREELERLHQQMTAGTLHTAIAARGTMHWLLLAATAAATGHPDLALTALDGVPADQRDAALAPELRRIRGDALASLGRLDEAEALLREAGAIAGRRSMRMPELRAATSLARVLVGQGRREEARARLAEVYAWFTEGFDTRDLREARAALERLAQ